MAEDNLELFRKIPVMEPHEHPTADEVLNKQGESFTLKGKTILVTGGSSGIGVETVRAFASRGARVLIGVRDVEKTKAVVANIEKAHPNNGGLDIFKLDLESLASVSAAADEVLRKTDQLNILVNNAGVMSTPYQLTKDGHEYQFGVNYLGHFLLTKKLLPLLVKSSTPGFQSRVVNVSSSMHWASNVDLNDLHFTTRGYDPDKSYGQSKTSNILFANEIERRYGSQGVHAFSLHPGGIITELQRHMPKDDLIKKGMFNDKGEYQMHGFKMKTVPQGAATSVWAAVGKDLEGKGGKYLDNVAIAEPSTQLFVGYAPYIYDAEAAQKLWEYSEKAVSAFV